MRISAVAIVVVSTVIGAATAAAQTTPPACWVRGDPADIELRASPFDSTEVVLEGGRVEVCYSRPRKLGRPIMGRLVAYGEAWRFGANEATAIHVPTRATIAGVPVEPGWYSLMAVPGPVEWRIVVNGEPRRWGVPIDDQVRSRDLGSGMVPATEEVGVVELFTLELVPTGRSAAELVMAWDRTRLRIPVVLESNGGPESRP